jgi:hypothetical protein
MEEVKTKAKRTPEQQATHDKEMAERVKVLYAVAPKEVHAQAAFCLADMVRAVIEGRLKPEDIPPTLEELLVITYVAVSRKMLEQKFKEMFDGQH